MIRVETAVTANPPRLLTIEEYVRLPDDGRKTELVRGRIVEVPPTYPFHGYVCSKIDRILGGFVDTQKLGRVMTNDSGVVTERDPDTLRGADVCYYSYRRSRVFAKVTEYLTAGVTAVCVVNPESGTAIVYRDNQDPESFAADVELSLPDVLPGFRVPLRQFFE
jgi:Uma2 family endonuclease